MQARRAHANQTRRDTVLGVGEAPEEIELNVSARAGPCQLRPEDLEREFSLTYGGAEIAVRTECGLGQGNVRQVDIVH